MPAGGGGTGRGGTWCSCKGRSSIISEKGHAWAQHVFRGKWAEWSIKKVKMRRLSKTPERFALFRARKYSQE